MALFDRNAVNDGTQITTPRYLQEDSSIVNGRDAFTDDANATILSVASGKRLYITDIILTINSTGGAGTDFGYITDFGGSGQKILVQTQNWAAGTIVNYKFDTPLYFDSSFYWDAGSSATLNIDMTYSGWTENA